MNKKKIIIITASSCIVIIGCFIGAKYVLNKSQATNPILNETKQKLSEVTNEDSLTDLTVLDSIGIADSTEFFENEIKDELMDDIATTPIPKPIKSVNNENKVNNWILVKETGLDTSYFCIKNKITGTKLSNRYYSKAKADTELSKFRKILEAN